jgi:hypothetical protein
MFKGHATLERIYATIGDEEKKVFKTLEPETDIMDNNLLMLTPESYVIKLFPINGTQVN